MGTMAVAVVSYNTRDLLRDCLASAVAAGATELIVADNGSTDGSIEMVRRTFPSAELLVDATNPGYGAAGNRALTRAQSDYVLLLNSDTLLRRGALEALAGYLDAAPRAGMVGPRLLNGDGSLQPSCHEFPTPFITLLEYSWVGELVKLIPGVRQRYLRTWSHDRARSVAWVTGAALAIRRRASQEIGGFDERFFMYYEEVDFAYRLLHAGWETHFTPATSIVHFGGESTRHHRSKMFAQEYSAAMQFYARHHPPERTRRAARVLRFALQSKLLIGWVRSLLARDADERLAIAAFMDDVRRVLGERWLRAPVG